MKRFFSFIIWLKTAQYNYIAANKTMELDHKGFTKCLFSSDKLVELLFGVISTGGRH